MNPAQNPATWLPGDRLSSPNYPKGVIFDILIRNGGPKFIGHPEGFTGVHIYSAEDFRNISAEERENDIAPGHNTDRLTRDWLEDAPHENGRYQCLCSICDGLFFGHKRRAACKLCSRIAELERLTTELTETKAKLVAVTAERETAEAERDLADTGLRDICLIISDGEFDPSDGEGTSAHEVAHMVKAECDALRAKLAESERRMAQEHFEKMYALQDRLEKAEKERDEARQAIESICCVFRHPPLPEQLPRLVHELRKESDAANTRAIEAGAQVERAWKEAYDRAHASMQMHSFPDQTHNAWLASPTYAAMQSKEGK